MSDLRRDLKKNYKQMLSQKWDNDGELEHQCLSFFKDTGKNDCFKLLPFYDALKVFHDKCKRHPSRRVLHRVENLYSLLEEAFIHLKHYSLNLLARPWSKDVHTIKVYTGFFHYKIKQWISFDIACKILELHGYHKKKPTGDFEFDAALDFDEERILVVSFELYLAHTLLKFFQSKHDNKLVEHLMDPEFVELQLELNQQKQLEPNVGLKSAATTAFQHNNGITTVELKDNFDKNGQLCSDFAKNRVEDLMQQEIEGEHSSLGVNPDDLDDDALYGEELPDQNIMGEIPTGSTHKKGVSEKDENREELHLYESITLQPGANQFNTRNITQMATSSTYLENKGGIFSTQVKQSHRKEKEGVAKSGRNIDTPSGEHGATSGTGTGSDVGPSVSTEYTNYSSPGRLYEDYGNDTSMFQSLPVCRSPYQQSKLSFPKDDSDMKSPEKYEQLSTDRHMVPAMVNGGLSHGKQIMYLNHNGVQSDNVYKKTEEMQRLLKDRMDRNSQQFKDDGQQKPEPQCSICSGTPFTSCESCFNLFCITCFYAYRDHPQCIEGQKHKWHVLHETAL